MFVATLSTEQLRKDLRWKQEGMSEDQGLNSFGNMHLEPQVFTPKVEWRVAGGKP